MPVQNSNSKILHFQIYILRYFKFVYQLYLIAYCVKKSNLHFSHVLEDSLFGYHSVINHKKVKLRFLHRNFYMSTKEFLMKLPVEKTGRMAPG